MISSKSIRAGILVAIAAAGSWSCGGETEFTQPNPQSDIVAVQASEVYLNSPQQETRELLIDGRVTDIEWNVTGDPSIVLLEGVSGGGGNYYVSVRSMWTVDRFGAPDGILFLLQWPDLTEDRLEEPLLTSADVVSEQGDTLNCAVDDALIREENWTRSGLQEDEVTIELFSDELGSFPKDIWRWGASTTDFSSPVSCTEFVGACTDGDAVGSTEHPSAANMEDFYDIGSGSVRDAGNLMFIPNHTPGSNVPRRIVDKGTRDTRFNRGKPVPFVVWERVSKPFLQCELLNPIRIDEASVRDKTWNPGDYVPAYRAQVPDSSQSDVLGKGGWLSGKWALEIRRELVPRQRTSEPLPPARPDDIQLVPGRRYLMRISVTDGTTKATSRSPLVPVFLKPNSP